MLHRAQSRAAVVVRARPRCLAAAAGRFQVRGENHESWRQAGDPDNDLGLLEVLVQPCSNVATCDIAVGLVACGVHDFVVEPVGRLLKVCVGAEVVALVESGRSVSLWGIHIRYCCFGRWPHSVRFLRNNRCWVNEVFW